ncbi:16S rRNA (uracil(1498)-N(3))-methyltransferase [Microbacteriaceae bacterium VKM Ac-2855]|nr:16S rRNA (uracil(1498)-N(3))-methyltransferase [Microbacteriaceae bacterium VKM Ac-2855]
MAHHYIDETLDTAAFVAGGTLVLTGAEARHAATVSRIRAGESIRVGDGRGLIATATATVTDAAPARLELRVDSVETVAAAAPRLVLAQALAKGDRDELAVQAATELGVDEIVPWQAARSVSRWTGPKEAKGRERWASIVREASKQSLRGWVPGVVPIVSTKQLAARGERILVLEPSASAALTSLSFDDRDLLLVVGPEGGVAADELELLTAAGAELVRMGTNVLRTSTAGPAAIAVLSAALGRW